MYPLRRILPVLLFVFVLCFAAGRAAAQATVGSITGTVTDPSGSVVPNVEVTVVERGTGLVRTAKTNNEGAYSIPDLPIGQYTVTMVREGFSTQKFPSITVQSDRTVTLGAQLKLGEVATSVTVDANPLLNATDTTNGYVLDKQQIDNIPQPTGTPLGMAILSPGVNAELPTGTGANDGLGNPPIWANGQRDTSNSFALNGVDGSSLFNGKSTSSVGSARVINSTGVSTSLGGGGVIQSVASVYLSIGNALPTPAPESLEEVRVNASLYDATQGSTSGAHIDLNTASGTNAFHGSVYGNRETSWLNAAPFFFKQDPDVPDSQKNPPLHRYLLGATFGGPIIKDKLFGFVAYQHLHVSDNYLGDSFLDVPVGLSDTNRTAAGLADLVNNNFGYCPNGSSPSTCTQLGQGDVDPIALALFNAPSLPGEPGKWLIPNDSLFNASSPGGVDGQSGLSAAHPYNAFIPGTGRFKADVAVADLDWNATAKDTMAFRYFYQHDPTIAPYAYSSVPGFDEHLDSGAQVLAIQNTYLVTPKLSTQAEFGFSREKTWMDNVQPFGPTSIPGTSATINTFGSNYFPGISIVNVLGNVAYDQGLPSTGILNIGPNSEGQSSNTGVFQNRFNPSANAIWSLGKHQLQFGSVYSYTQLNTIDKRTGMGTIATDDLSQFMQGNNTTGSSATQFYVSTFLSGNANRYYRANQLGLFVQDKFQITANLSITAGVRYDWDGGLTEKYGRIFNFDASRYSYNASSDTILNPGFVIAGNNSSGTSGVSDTTLTGRQWGLAPRLGAAWQPEMFHGKVVVRSGFGMYYDRGELFSYFSPGYAIGTVTGGPFGVNQQLPFVVSTQCAPSTYYLGYIPTCTPSTGGGLENPWGTTLNLPSAHPQSSDLVNYLPNIAGIDAGAQPISLGVYDRGNKLPYTYNYTFDIQWQPRNDVAIELGYVGNVGRHQVIPVPFNQANIASPSSPINGQSYSYGYTVQAPVGCTPGVTCSNATLPDGSTYLNDYEGGNVDHRVPYIGYAAESIDYKAAGVDAYNALQAHVDKRMSRHVQVGFSYTYSHALDEQSGLGLFYNGNNPLDLRDAYASADFDRTHVVNFSYIFTLPEFYGTTSVAGKLTSGWSLVGLTVLESGQPYSVIDFSGAVGSIYYSTADGITNPIVPLAPGCTPKNALTGKSGAFGDEALKSSCFTLPLLAPGSLNGAVPTNDTFETGFTKGQRNIFRSAFQKRADMSIQKQTQLTDRYGLKFSMDFFNVTNSASFDVPGNEVAQNENYNSFPVQGSTLYNPPFGLGVVGHTIGGPRQIQFALALKF